MHIAFLGYDRSQTRLIGFLEGLGHEVSHVAERIDDLSRFDCTISFGYRHILSQRVLDTAPRPVLNLHISWLPYNRGAHPNFWSWVEGTPSGVTIHEIDAGVDTGPIVAQARVDLEPAGLTFRAAYRILFDRIERLFEDGAAGILSGRYAATAQTGPGTAHKVRDLPAWLTSWDMLVTDAIAEHRRRG